MNLQDVRATHGCLVHLNRSFVPIRNAGEVIVLARKPEGKRKLEVLEDSRRQRSGDPGLKRTSIGSKKNVKRDASQALSDAAGPAGRDPAAHLAVPGALQRPQRASEASRITNQLLVYGTFTFSPTPTICSMPVVRILLITSCHDDTGPTSAIGAVNWPRFG